MPSSPERGGGDKEGRTKEQLQKFLEQAKALEAEKGMLGAIKEVLKDMSRDDRDFWYTNLHHTWTKEKQAAVGRVSAPERRTSRVENESLPNQSSNRDKPKSWVTKAIIEDAEKLRADDPEGSSSDSGLKE